MSENIIKTEIKLSEESVHEIVIAETAKALLRVEGFMEGIIQSVLFTRPTKRYSYDKEKPTFFESAVQKTLKPMIEEEIKKVAEAHRKKLTLIIRKAFKSGIIDNKEFEDRLIEKLSKFSSNITFYVGE